MRFAYADPPYVGQSKKHYGGVEVNHKFLIQYLCDYFDSWALSLSANSVRNILNLCPENVRVLAWVKPFATFKKNVNPVYSWEPVIIYNTRPRGQDKYFIHDHLVCSPQMGSKLIGQKPEAFCYWLFECLGMQPEDEFEDVFPGSDAVKIHWWTWKESKKDLFDFYGVQEVMPL